MSPRLVRRARALAPFLLAAALGLLILIPGPDARADSRPMPAAASPAPAEPSSGQ